MRRAIPLAVALALCAGAAQAQTVQQDPRDIPYFERNPAERRAVLRRCQSDVRIAASPICANAERAGSAQLGRPLPPPSQFPPPGYRRDDIRPIGKGSLRGT